MLRRRTATEAPRQTDDRSRRDRGVTFIELLVVVVLLGTTVIATLAMLQATVTATTRARDHAKAHQWLQSAVGVIQAAPFTECSDPSNGSDVQDAYELEVVTEATPPEGFAGGSITVSVPRVWDGSAYVDFDSQPSLCYDDNRLRQQLITISVTSPDANINESIEVVKRDG